MVPVVPNPPKAGLAACCPKGFVLVAVVVPRKPNAGAELAGVGPNAVPNPAGLFWAPNNPMDWVA